MIYLIKIINTEKIISCYAIRLQTGHPVGMQWAYHIYAVCAKRIHTIVVLEVTWWRCFKAGCVKQKYISYLVTTWHEYCCLY